MVIHISLNRNRFIIKTSIQFVLMPTDVHIIVQNRYEYTTNLELARFTIFWSSLASFLFFGILVMLFMTPIMFNTFPCSSAVEQTTVNRLVAGSIPAGGAKIKTP